MWVECFFKWRRPTSEKIVRPTASCDTSLYFYLNLETTLKNVIFSHGTLWEYALTKKTMKMTCTFREYLQRAILETLTFDKDKNRDKDIWKTAYDVF